MTNVTTLLALIGTNLPVIVVEQNDPTFPHIRPIWKYLRRLLYPLAASVVSASSCIDDYFSWISRDRRIVIHNMLMVDTAQDRSVEMYTKNKRSHKRILGMGRLVFQKGFDRLIDAFARIIAKHPDWDLYIIGEGELRPVLEQQIVEKKLETRVFLPGTTQSPFQVLRGADLFVLSSRHEGFGNVLVEALACGVPVISFDCKCGPGEIVRDGIDGLLVPPDDIDKLAIAMDLLMSDNIKRGSLAARAPEAVTRFGSEAVINLWETVLDQAVKTI
jgi:glycosyltransferase involved in cell wall biosynthesis